MLIRKATKEETDYIQSIGSQVQQEATMGYVNETNKITDYDLNAPYQGIYYVLTHQQRLQGWVLLGETRGPYTNDYSGVILELYVLPQFRKYGAGRMLMEFALDHFKHRGFNRVQLNVFAGNPARRLYEKLGFREVASLMETKI
ncbi:GNAT family N-acetyltransferase [Halalkalibacter urbisdiaboli]|uniref:GNAT family N-acetyltransferase n=1 Tax=Halalkalibacter urbisdiaboli TaxID=1960589 RepID=UPI000B44B2BF|nr:GNAT family N-acetyltransferase [Halalkalibacter urbisdiaboli]